MNKIEKLALKASLPNLTDTQINALDSIFSATDNVTVCIELILGIYEYPQLAQKSNISKDKVNCKFISFDPISNRVKYSYNGLNSANVWLPKEVVANQVKLEDYKETHPELFEYYCYKNQGKTENEWREVYNRVMIYGDMNPEVENDTVEYKTWMKNAIN